jgi:hypothetical protein
MEGCLRVGGAMIGVGRASQTHVIMAPNLKLCEAANSNAYGW